MANNEKTIKEYKNFRVNIENLGQKTIKSEMFVLITLSRHLKNKSFKQAKENDIAEYLNKYSAKTKDMRITILKHFYRWLYDIEKGERLPDQVRRIKRTVKSPIQYYNNMEYRERVIIEAEYQRLIDSAKGIMHQAMLETLYRFGCRASELLSMNATDVNYDGILTKIKVRDSKTEPRDIVCEGRPEYLMKWFENYQHFKEQKDKPLWTNFQKNKHNRYTINGLEKAITVISKRAGLRHITPHDFRHTAITNARKNGEDLTDIQSNFGLSKTSPMMAVYDHNKIKDYEEKIRKRATEIDVPTDVLKKEKETLIQKHAKEINELKEKLDLTMKAVELLVDEKEFKETYEVEKEDLESNKKFMIYVNKIRKKEKKQKITYEEFLKEEGGR